VRDDGYADGCDDDQATASSPIDREFALRSRSDVKKAAL
jgi:hypothetical protein